MSYSSSSVYILNGSGLSINYQLPHPLTRLLQFSQLGTYLILWEPYTGECINTCIYNIIYISGRY